MNSQNIQASIHNKFVFEVEDITSGKTKTIESYNVVLDNFWTKKAYRNGWFTAIQLGDGQGIPAATDTTLFNKLGNYSMSNIKRSWSYDDLTMTSTGDVYLNENTLNGKDISEIGLFVNLYGHGEVLLTHARLTDMNGNPIVIQKTETTRIRIYSTVYIRVSPHTGNGVYYNKGTCNLAYMFLTGDITSTIYCDVIGSNVYQQTISKTMPAWRDLTDPLTPKDVVYTPTTSSAVFGTTEANFSNANIMVVTFRPYRWMLYDDWFIGDRITGEALGTGDGVKTKFKTKFQGCINPAIYIDGVQVYNFTAYPRSPITGSMYGGYYEQPWAHCVIIDENTGESLYTDHGSTGGLRIDKGKRYMYLKMFMYEDGWEFEYRDYSLVVATSNDLVVWTDLAPYTPRLAKYVRIDTSILASDKSTISDVRSKPPAKLGTDLCNIVFDEPPASGAVITIDYNPKTLRKNKDTTMSLQFGGELRLTAAEF